MECRLEKNKNNEKGCGKYVFSRENEVEFVVIFPLVLPTFIDFSGSS